MRIFPVETDRLRMRPLGPQDSALYCHLFSDEETMRFIGAPMAPERAARSFSGALAGMNRDPIERLFFTVVEKGSGQDVGICSLQNFDAQRRSAQAGVMFVARARAQGYSKEGFAALLQQAFVYLPVDELWVQFAADHIVAERVATSMGLELQRAAASEDGPQRRSVWSVHRDSWLPKFPARD